MKLNTYTVRPVLVPAGSRYQMVNLIEAPTHSLTPNARDAATPPGGVALARHGVVEFFESEADALAWLAQEARR